MSLTRRMMMRKGKERKGGQKMTMMVEIINVLLAGNPTCPTLHYIPILSRSTMRTDTQVEAEEGLKRTQEK